jgi:hypothetical protein
VGSYVGGLAANVVGYYRKILHYCRCTCGCSVLLGFLAFVNDLWYVDYEYGFRFLAAWHAAGLIDKEVILSVGTLYLLLSLPISFVLL